ncbi:hypothetical protein ACFL6Y_05685 [Elusimicrobiota bacterium]
MLKTLRFILIVTCMLMINSTNSWALIGGVISGAKAVKDEAHKRIVENQLIQLAITAKKNYDASVKIYKQAKILNQGKGIIHNVASDLGVEAKKMSKQEELAVKGEFGYYNDSQIDKYLGQLDENARVFVERRGKNSLGFMDGVNKESAEYSDTLKNQWELVKNRSRRGQATREEGIKIAGNAKTATGQALGLELQASADQTEAVNQLVSILAAASAKENVREINQKQAMEELVGFLSDKNGAHEQVMITGRLTDPVRIPALYSRQRKKLGNLVLTMLGLFVAGGLIWAFLNMCKTKEMTLSEVLGVPLALVFFGLMAYDGLFTKFTVVLRTAEETISPWNEIAETFLSPQMAQRMQGVSSRRGSSSGDSKKQGLKTWLTTGWLTMFGMAAAGASLVILQAFFWVRYALLALCYVLGPLMIAFCLVPPLRKLSVGWLMTCLELGLNGIGMRVFMAVVSSSSIQALFDSTTAGGGSMAVTSVIVNIVFLMVSITTPFLIHSMVHGSALSVAMFLPTLATARTAASAGKYLAQSATRTKYDMASLARRILKK